MADEKDTVKDVVEILHDGQKGFAELGKHLQVPQVTLTRSQFAGELESAAGLGNDTGGTASGAMHRFWGDLKGKMGAGDHALLETAEQGEDVVKKAYQEALQKPEVSGNIRQILEKQQTHIRQSHDQVKTFRGQQESSLSEQGRSEGRDSSRLSLCAASALPIVLRNELRSILDRHPSVAGVGAPPLLCANRVAPPLGFGEIQTIDLAHWKGLEISSKSKSERGQHLSAFYMKVRLDDREEIPLECAFQGSKVFERGGPFTDLYWKEPSDAKRDPRLKESGSLKGFKFQGFTWPLEPKTVFYDWLYISFLKRYRDWAPKLYAYGGFTDVEFNPHKSINCQARSCALFLSLIKRICWMRQRSPPATSSAS